MGSATSNEANKSAMLHTEWTITAHRAVLHLALSVFFPRMLQAECNFETIYEC